MILEKHQYRRFIRLYETLINYCAVEAGTQESLEASILNEDVKAFLEAERMIWAPDGDRGIIDRYVEKNPFNFSMDDLAEVQSWSRAINDTFTVCQRGLETLFICGWRAFSVRGLDREIGEALSHMPATVRATLLPFDDTIIFAITMSEIAYETDRDKIERIEREVTDYLKLDKVHRTAHEFIMLTIGPKWEQSASLLPYLCLSCAFTPLTTLMSDSVVTRGKSGIYMWNTLALGLCEIVLMTILWPYGIRTMVYAFVAVNLLWVPVWFFFLHRLTAYRWLSFLTDIVPFALAALGVMVATHFITNSLQNYKLLLGSRIVIAAALYYLVMLVARVQILKDCQQFLLSRLTKRKQ